MDSIVSNITITQDSVKSNIYDGIDKVYTDGITITGTGTYDNPLVAEVTGGSGAVDSVNGQTGAVVLDADDIDDTSTAHKFVSTIEKNTWNSKQDALGFTPENTANKTDAMSGNTTSSTKFLSAKGVYDWVISLGYITSAALSNYLQKNAAITGATKTKITYDSNGLVTGGADASTADIADSSDKRYVTDAQLTVIGNTSGTNSGNETASTLGATINAASAAVPNDTDLVATVDTSVVKKITWTNVRAFLKIYFDTLYQAAGTYLTSANISDTAYDSTSWDGVTTIAPSKNAVRDKFVSVESAKQDALVSGSNIKTVNGTTILGSGNIAIPATIQLAVSDETTAITAGTGKITFRMPHAMTVTAVRASLTTAQTSGNIFTVDINEGGTSIISTKITIDNTEKTSTTAATPPVISDASLADDAEITVDVDQIGDGTAKGLKVTLIGTIA